MIRMILLVSLVVCCILAKAQMAITNNGNLQIHTGASVAGFANFTNTSSGVLVNNGTLHLKANITNHQASMNAGTGTLHLDGSSSQTIDGTNTFNTYNLVTDNAAGIVLNNNLGISNAHTFSAGVIATSATPNYIVYGSSATYTGISDSRHVNGWVKKLGSANFVFPVGNGTMQRTITLNTLSANSEFDVRYAATAPDDDQLQMPLLDLHSAEYWMVNRISGGTAAVVMNWDDSKVDFPNWTVSEITGARYDGSSWEDIGGTASGNVSTTGITTSPGISTFNYFTIGSRVLVVPLTLMNFNAKRSGNYTDVMWSTMNEQHVDHFSVERSEDNKDFYSIGKVRGRNTQRMENYAVKDYKPINQIAYYRLRSVDADGKEKLSRIVALTNKVEGGMLTLLANPVQNKVSLMAGDNIRGVYNYTITGANGQVVQQGTLSIETAGRYHVPLTPGNAHGNYVLNIQNGEHSFTFRLIINK